ncbi:MAG: hypothetical protein D6748_02550 [Calditrichaeota bacterium]|nr:MAG: hypothetical protein D6748_02550 [Calditrichota bacterium]
MQFRFNIWHKGSSGLTTFSLPSPEWITRRDNHHLINRVSSTVLSLSILFIFLALICSCNAMAPEIHLPDSIQGLPLRQKISGKEAEKMLERMHNKDVAPGKNVIGVYQAGPHRTILYASSFPTRGKALDRLEEMSKEIGSGSSGFENHIQFEVNKNIIHQVTGYGQLHYFFAVDKFLYWLSVDYPLAHGSLAELLGVSIDDIPSSDNSQ